MTEEIDSKEFGLRLKEVRKHLKILQKDFAHRIGMKNSYLSGIENGKFKPGFDFFYKITREFRINPYYLLHNELPMFLDQLSPHRCEEKDFGEANKRVHELISYIESSPMVKFDMLGYFSRYRIQNQSLIEEDIKMNETSSDEEKKDQ
jgi:transcriptional regulator with XRE-family HTH domain